MTAETSASESVAEGTDLESGAGRGALVGAAVALSIVATWVWLATCDDDGMRCLGNVVLAIFAMPLVAFVVGLVVARLVHLRRPWLLALVGPVVAFGALRSAFLVLEPGAAGLAASCVVVVVGYAGLAHVLRPGTRPWVRVAYAVVVAVLVLAPGLDQW